MFAVEPSVEIAHRTDFSLLCNDRGLLLYAIEVGTDIGMFAKDFLSRWRGYQMILVDPYVPHEEFPWPRDGDFAVAIQGLSAYHGRFRFLKAKSVDVAQNLPHWIHPQFVYIDGSHIYADVKQDLENWWPTLSKDGILAGHDFDDSHPDVVRAVTEFAEKHQLTVRVTREVLPSWYIYVTEPPTLLRRYFDLGEVPNPRVGG